MGSHFKDSQNGAGTGYGSAAGRHSAPRTNAANGAARSSQLYTGGHLNGGDESYHAPAGNRFSHAAAPDQITSGYVSVVGSGNNDGRRSRGKNRRTNSSHFAETDPYDIKGRRSKDPKKRRNRIISACLFVVGIVLLLVAGGIYLYNQNQYAEQDQINEKLAAYATLAEDGNSAPVVDWASLKAINSDVVGWVQVPNTTVNFPVYQGADNDAYLHTNAEGNYSLGGQVFMDSENTAPGLTDNQTIIYGHHLRNGAMFKPIADMDTQGMLDSVKTVWYVTEQANYELEPIFVYKTTGDDETVREFSFSTDDEWRAYLSGLLAKAVTKSSDAATAITKANHVLTLCTCNYSGNETGRTILVCALKSEVNQAAASADAAATTDSATATDAATQGDESGQDETATAA